MPSPKSDCLPPEVEDYLAEEEAKITKGEFKSYKAPPSVWLVWCPQCGRNDRWSPLKAGHFSGGKRCKGTPMVLGYTLVTDPCYAQER